MVTHVHASKRRAGFTLIETVVTVGLLAVLAAFVVPSVLRKADSADPVKVANDLNAISTALQTFSSDMKGIMPGDLQDLTQPVMVNSLCNQATPCDTTIDHKTPYTAKQALLWKGPYLAASLERDPNALLRSGYVADFSNTLTRFDAVNGVPELCQLTGGGAVTCNGFVATNPLFIAIKVTGLNRDQALQINAIIDGVNEINPGFEGRFRFTADGSLAFFLASPMS
ncbi:MAG TPA: prepilin-type N-terminal cleavage/methylation domain-containing protein [Gemmatimonadaceae bacterium]|jgi:prepilin-type N-terminal cleavage/methylation domain-containing protein